MKKLGFFITSAYLAASLLAPCAWAATQNNEKTTFSPSQVKAIEKIINDYLITNPKILLKASQALQQQQAEEAQKNALTAIKANINKIFSDAKSPIAGNPNGTIQVVEFFDYQCGHCKAMSPIIKGLIKSNPNVKVIFKELPIFGGNSRYAAKAALASTQQGKYYPFHNALLNTKSQLSPQSILSIAKKVNLNGNKLKKAMNQPWVAQQLRLNFELAQQLKLLGTPAFIISNKDHTKFRFIPGATSAAGIEQQIAAISKK